MSLIENMHWETTVIALVAFALLYLFLNKKIFKPLFRIIDQRRALVQGQIDSAEQSRKNAELLLEEQKLAIAETKKEAFAILEQTRSTGAKQLEDIVGQAKSEATRLKEEALKDIEIEKNNAVAALRSQVSALSVMIASKIIEKQVDEKSQEELVEHYLKEVGGKQ
jgi:F-type H+-transporting ATPase subunit b